MHTCTKVLITQSQSTQIHWIKAIIDLDELHRSTKKNCFAHGFYIYICREFIKMRVNKYDLRKNLKMSEAYQAYFDLPVKNQDKI